MATKHFCDLCGKPAMTTGFTTLHFARGGVLNRCGFHLNVEFTDAGSSHPKTTDCRADICTYCMADGLRVIAEKLNPTVELGL